MNHIFKYPRTSHIRGSRLQPGDEGFEDMPISELKGRNLVIEEKMDGANCGISFGPNGLLLQSRGHYLSGGPREKQFALFKTWANTFAPQFEQVLGERYVMYGEWLYAKHTTFYNNLRHYFLEFDILDMETGIFLDTPSRQELLKPLPMVKSVRVLQSGPAPSLAELKSLIGESEAIVGNHFEDLREIAIELKLDPNQVLSETENSHLMEGLYIKLEEEGQVLERYKFVRAGFLQTLTSSGSHWMDRPLIPNQLAPEVELFQN